MLLTGPAILAHIASGDLVIDPLPTDARVNPNSVDLRLGTLLRVYQNQLNYLEAKDRLSRSVWSEFQMSQKDQFPPTEVLDPYNTHATVDIPLPAGGIALVPGVFYLGYTIEMAGSTRLFAPVIEGRSTWARLSLQTHASAGWADVGFRRQWTLEITVSTPVTVRPGDAVCQVAFFHTTGVEQLYAGRYADQSGPQAARPLIPDETTGG